MKLGKASPKTKADIPTCSMADISFLLIIFFMLTTTLMSARGFPVSLPIAVSTKTLPKKNIAYMWVSDKRAISIDDNMVKLEYISSIMKRKLATNPSIIVSIVMDKKSEYGMLADIFEQLKEAGTLRVSMCTLKER